MKGDGTWTYTWEAGRKLKQMSKSRMTVEYAYDHNGLRMQKKVTQGNVVTTTDYTLHGKLLMHMKQGSDELHFFYDANSRPAMVKYNGTLYTYVHNLQGDIVAILDNNGAKVVEYKYDAWGKPLATTGSMASTLGALNPFRYRGYVYDQETELYYLRSRYYHPIWTRFTNSDTAIYNPNDLLYADLFTYCNNAPIKATDRSGGLAEDLYGTKGNTLAPDRTREINALLKKNMATAFWWRIFLIPFGALQFYNHVKDFGKWDYKREINTPEWVPEGGKLSYNGLKMTTHEFGNYHYGYMGAYMGFSPKQLFIGGGVVDVKNNGVNWDNWKYYFDQEDDHYWILMGIEDYKSIDPNYTYPIESDDAGFWLP